MGFLKIALDALCQHRGSSVANMTIRKGIIRELLKRIKISPVLNEQEKNTLRGYLPQLEQDEPELAEKIKDLIAK